MQYYKFKQFLGNLILGILNFNHIGISRVADLAFDYVFSANKGIHGKQLQRGHGGWLGI